MKTTKRSPIKAGALKLRLSLDLKAPALIGPPQQYACNAFHYDLYGVHLQTCQSTSEISQVHEWVVHKWIVLLGSVGHRVKIHKITTSTGKERG